MYLPQGAKTSVCLSEEYFEKFNFFIPFLSKNERHLRVSHLKQKQTEHLRKSEGRGASEPLIFLY